jgi:hypothetical protein
MAQIELRYATVRVVDGFSASAAVNHSGGYVEGDTTMLIDTVVSGPIPVTATFTVVGSDRIHVVTSGNGTSTITFSPPLTGAVADDAVITVGGRCVEANLGTGNLTYDEGRNFTYDLNRGNLDTVRQGDEKPISVKLDYKWEFLTAVMGSGLPTIEDAFKKRGEASGWVSSSDDPCEPFAVDVQIEYVPNCEGVDREIIILPDFRWETLSHDPQKGSISVSGQCNATEALVSRADNS